MLMLYVTFIEDDNVNAPDELSYYWPKNSLPNYQSDNGGHSQLIDWNHNNPSNAYNLTQWFKTMSMTKDTNGVINPKFSITAGVFHVQISRGTSSIPIDTSENRRNRLDEIENEFCRRAIIALAAKYPNQDWSVFDKRQNLPHWSYDNSTHKSNVLLPLSQIV